MKEDLEIIDLDKELNEPVKGVDANKKEDLTVTRAQAKVEELERELRRLQQAKNAQNDSKPKPVTDKIAEKKPDKTPEPEKAKEIPERKKYKSNAEAYASSERNIAMMLDEYDAISSDDGTRRKKKHDKLTVQERPAGATRMAKQERKPVPQRPQQPVKAEGVAKPQQPAKPEGVAKPQQPVKAEGATKPQQPVRPEGTAKPQHPVNTEGATKPQHPAKPEGAAKPQQPVKAEGAAKPQHPAKPEGAVKPQQPAKPEGAAKPQHPVKPEGAAKPQQPAKAEGTARPQKPVDAEAISNQKESGQAKHTVDTKKADKPNAGRKPEGHHENVRKNDARHEMLPHGRSTKSAKAVSHKRDDYEDYGRKKPGKKKGGNFFSNLTGMDYVIALTGVLILVAAILTGSIYSTVQIKKEQLASFSEIGDNMSEIGIAGESALLAMAQNREDETIVIEEEYTVTEYDEKDDESEGNVTVTMKLQSVVKDLKIKFINKKTGKLVPGVPFQVEITDSAKNVTTKTDDDKDGIIYIKSFTPGDAKVKMVALTGYDAYSLTTDIQTINVKETLDYKKIDVADEVKTEAQVNVAAEDTAHNQVTATESELKDTVEWVESTKTAINGTEAYVTVARGDLDPVPDEVKNGGGSSSAEEASSDLSASAGNILNLASTCINRFRSYWTLDVYAAEATTEEGSTEQPTSSEQPQSSEPSSESPSSSEENKSDVDWGKVLTINGITVYVDKECTRKATYKDYSEQSEFYVKNSNGSAATEYKYTGWQTLDGATYFFDKDGNKVTGDQVIQGAKYSFGSDGVLKTGSGVLGIDVSKWNGSIDWNQVKSSGISYVIIRCGYRGSTTGALIEDPTFRSNIKGAQAAGLKVGVYFFTQATDEVEAVEEASMTLNLISGYKLSYPVFLDVESSGGRGDKIDPATRTKVINAYCQTIRNSGYSAGVYANKTWLNEKFSPGSLSGCRIWLAQYAATPTYGGTYQMWQYTSKGSVKGIKGNVDMNLSYMN